MLTIRHLHVSVEGKEILRGVSLDVRAGEVVALLGPNGSGKSTLAHTLMGHPRYIITAGTAEFRGENLLDDTPEERARRGLFLSFQYPPEIPGVPLGAMLRTALAERTGTTLPAGTFIKLLDEKLALLTIGRAFAERSVNAGFSGGEKKRAEILQLAVLAPALAILDETDSGLDVDAFRIVAEGIQRVRAEHPDMAILLITHYDQFLEFLVADRVLVMKEGTIVAHGSRELAKDIRQHGYGGIVSTPT